MQGARQKQHCPLCTGPVKAIKFSVWEQDDLLAYSFMSPTQSAEQEKISPVGAQPTGQHRDLCALTHSGDRVQLQWRGPQAAGPCCHGSGQPHGQTGCLQQPFRTLPI